MRIICCATECMCNHGIVPFSIRRLYLDETFLRKVEANHYKVNLSDHIQFNTVGRHNTKHRTLDTHDRLNQAKYSNFNRARKLLVSNIVPTNPDRN